MTINQFDIEATTDQTRQTLAQHPSLDSSLRGVIELLIMIVSLLCGRLKLNSQNSSKPPSQDPHRPKAEKSPGPKKPGGRGHKGTTLQKVEHPDRIVPLPVDRATLPVGEYRAVGYRARPVFDYEVKVVVTEFRAEILQSAMGQKFVAPFPPGVSHAAQYGASIKANADYMNCYQMASLARIEDHFHDQLGLPVSKGSIYNFSREAFRALAAFAGWAKRSLLASGVLHADETGVNIDGRRHWLHVLCTDKISWFHVDAKRGQEAMKAMEVLPDFSGILCHDHWKPYFRFACEPSLCNAHHLRELTFAQEEEKQTGAGDLKQLLLDAHAEVTRQGGSLEAPRAAEIQKQYQDILARGELESPPPQRKEGQRGRAKKTKSRNLLERLKDFETETLRFLREREVSFTYNQGENDWRMTQVQQKVSGCFRSMEGAPIFARIRSYINICRKNDVRPTEALTLLFEGRLPDFINL